MNIIIIGAGPAGNYVAYLLASSGHQVSVYEEHDIIGSPVQCTGLLSSEFDKFKLPSGNFLVNKFNKIIINSPNEKVIIKQKEHLVDRTKFDQYLAHLAKDAGAKYFLSHAFLRREGSALIIKDLSHNEEKIVLPDIIIAADGPLSKLAKSYNFYNIQRKNYLGMQAIVEGEFDSDSYQTFFGKEVCPDFFAWIVPESYNRARVGVASKSGARQHFEKFVEKHQFKVKEIQAGTIPVYNSEQKVLKDNCCLLGDAACQVKATTLGGIIPAMKAAQVLASCIDRNKVKEYPQKLAKINKGLLLHLKVRNALDKFTDEDWDKLIKFVKQKRILKTFGKYSRDNPIPLFTSLLLKEPRFLYFFKHII